MLDFNYLIIVLITFLLLELVIKHFELTKDLAKVNKYSVHVLAATYSIFWPIVLLISIFIFIRLILGKFFKI